MKYPIAEKFKSVQGEGVYAGKPMAFIRLVGCSVGQKICTACDTHFDEMYTAYGGGLFEPEELIAWAEPYDTICITGGEPFDRMIRNLVEAAHDVGMQVHVETSGTVKYDSFRHGAINWICVSPKPGYRPDVIDLASEIKVIHNGLGDGDGWPTVEDAVAWSKKFGTPVYLQPRNFKHIVDDIALKDAMRIVDENPSLRLSVQLHKFLGAR
jgi:7-carboxy-7-deazaguanine synthase